MFFTAAIYGALYAITGSSRVSWISSARTSRRSSTSIFRLKPRYATPWEVSLLVIIGLIVALDLSSKRRVRGVEVVT